MTTTTTPEGAGEFPPLPEPNSTSFLIQIVGEDIDHPLTAILPDWDAVRRFCVEHYVGSEDHTTYWGERTLDILKREFEEHEAEETGKPYTEQWEIGGLTIERVEDCTPPAAPRAQAAPAAASGAVAEATRGGIPQFGYATIIRKLPGASKLPLGKTLLYAAPTGSESGDAAETKGGV